MSALIDPRLAQGNPVPVAPVDQPLGHLNPISVQFSPTDLGRAAASGQRDPVAVTALQPCLVRSEAVTGRIDRAGAARSGLPFHRNAPPLDLHQAIVPVPEIDQVVPAEAMASVLAGPVPEPAIDR